MATGVLSIILVAHCMEQKKRRSKEAARTTRNDKNRRDDDMIQNKQPMEALTLVEFCIKILWI
jgi:hypothetical protein